MYKDDNIALVVGRSGRALPENWDLVFITNNITDLNIFYRGGGNTFPLYIRDGFSGHWKSNLSLKFIEKLERCFDKKVNSIDVIFYIFAVLNCPLYREQFSQELEQDFPHIPITKDFGLFSKIVKFGNQLYSYYTLRSENPIKTSFPKNGTDKIELVKYDEETKRVYINKEQYFAGVSTQTWKYSVGSYFVCEKWLKDRKHKVLTLNEIQTYIKIASTIPNILSLWIQLDDTFEDILNNEILSFAPGNMKIRMDEFK
jgi:predicted helicase